MASKSVKFTKERGSRRTDSGVGSLSDQDSRGPTPERAYVEYDQRNSISALQEALVSMRDERDQWKRKAKELDADLTDVKKDLKETEARWRALVDRNELIDHERQTVANEKKALQTDYDILQDELDRAHRKIEKLSNSAPVMSGAIPPSPSSEKKMRRSSSRKEKERSAEAERAAERAAEKAEKEKLKSRFERSDESDTRSSSTTKTRRRRDSYIEPLGQSAPRPVPVPPSPTRHFPNYATAPMQDPQYTTIREPVVGSVPRTPSIHPTVTYTYETPGGYYEDGNYHIHPLPVKSSRDRR